MARRSLDLRCAALTPEGSDDDGTVWRQWQTAAADEMTALYGARPAPVAPSTMVLHYYVSALAEASVQLALVSRLIPPAIATWSARRSSPGGYVPLVGIPENGWRTATSAADSIDVAQRRYLEHAEGVARAYPALVKTSSHQRLGLVHDAWQGALLGARDGLVSAGLADRLPPEPRRRQACCFIVALPGTTPCAGCPRLG